jgi:hypothetical protein
MTETKPPVFREPKTIRILEAVERIQASDGLADEDAVGELKSLLKDKVVEEARRR